MWKVLAKVGSGKKPPYEAWPKKEVPPPDCDPNPVYEGTEEDCLEWIDKHSKADKGKPPMEVNAEAKRPPKKAAKKKAAKKPAAKKPAVKKKGAKKPAAKKSATKKSAAKKSGVKKPAAKKKGAKKPVA